MTISKENSITVVVNGYRAEMSKEYAENAKKGLTEATLIVGGFMKQNEDLAIFANLMEDKLTESNTFEIVAGPDSDLLLNFAAYICATESSIKDPEAYEKFRKIINGASKGGKTHHATDRQAFKNDYRAERDESLEIPRPTIIDGLTKNYPNIVRSTLDGWAKDADQEDDFIRKPGRPKKR